LPTNRLPPNRPGGSREASTRPGTSRGADPSASPSLQPSCQPTETRQPGLLSGSCGRDARSPVLRTRTIHNARLSKPQRRAAPSSKEPQQRMALELITLRGRVLQVSPAESLVGPARRFALTGRSRALPVASSRAEPDPPAKPAESPATALGHHRAPQVRIGRPRAQIDIAGKHSHGSAMQQARRFEQITIWDLPGVTLQEPGQGQFQRRILRGPLRFDRLQIACQPT